MDTERALPGQDPGNGRSPGRSHSLLVWGLVALAVGLRVYQYLRNPPVWCDEVWLLRNIIGKTFLEQLGPLSDIQAAPPLFLWAERLVSLVLGSGIYGLRLLPLLASCGAVLLLVPLGRRCLRASALPWALLLLGYSDQVLDYTCEVKPYVSDMFLAVAIAALFCCTRSWRLGPRLALFTVLAPVTIFLAYPGCFIYGGLLVALLPSLWGCRRRWQAWLGYGLLLLTTFAAFVLLVAGPVRAQHTAALDACWVDYPDWGHPWAVPGWSLIALLRLLENLWRPTGGALIVPAAIGAFSLWRRDRRPDLLLLAVPVLLAMLAAWVRAYAFESRVVLYAFAAIVLLAGEGVAVIGAGMRAGLAGEGRPRLPIPRAAGVAGLVVFYLLLLAPLGRTAYYVVVPRPRLTCERWPETSPPIAAAPGRPGT